MKKPDRKRHYLPASPNRIIIFVQHLKEEGRTPSTIRICLSAIAERHKTCRYTDPIADYLVIKTVKGVASSRPHVDQCQAISSRDLSLIIKFVSFSKCSCHTVVLLRAMFSLMFFGFLRVSEITASHHNVSVSQCRIKPSKLRLVFNSYKHSCGRPFSLDLLPTTKTACSCRRMVDYIKLRGHEQGPFFAMRISCQLKKTAFAKYLKAVIARTELAEHNYGTCS